MRKHSNPWPSFRKPSLGTFLKSVHFDVRGPNGGTYPTRVLAPDFSFNEAQYRHEGYTLGILFDPMWSERCSPCPLFGPKRGLKPPCCVKDLPYVNIVIISHDHYDHLDKKTILEIERHFPGVICYVPQGVKQILERLRLSSDRIREQAWWEEEEYPLKPKPPPEDLQVAVETTVEVFGQTSPISSASSVTLVESTRKKVIESSPSSSPTTLVETLNTDSPVKILCTPAQHNSGRSLFSQNKTLWASWVVELPRTGQQPWRIFFAGDTGYRSEADGPVCPLFQEIRQRYGPPDLALLPIAAGSVLPYLEHLLPIQLDHHRLTSSIHCSSEDAVAISQVLGAKKSLGIHWGTFTTPTHARRTLEELQIARKAKDVRCSWSQDGGFRHANVGEWLNVSSPVVAMT